MSKQNNTGNGGSGAHEHPGPTITELLTRIVYQTDRQALEELLSRPLPTGEKDAAITIVDRMRELKDQVKCDFVADRAYDLLTAKFIQFPGDERAWK